MDQSERDYGEYRRPGVVDSHKPTRFFGLVERCYCLDDLIRQALMPVILLGAAGFSGRCGRRHTVAVAPCACGDAGGAGGSCCAVLRSLFLLLQAAFLALAELLWGCLAAAVSRCSSLSGQLLAVQLNMNGQRNLEISSTPEIQNTKSI